MLIENQEVEMVWNGSTKDWYIDKGYTFTNYHDRYMVNINDLPLSSNKKVRVICDYCGDEFQATYNNYNKDRIKIDTCKKCRHQKVADITREKRANKYYEKCKKIADEKGYELVFDVDSFKTCYDKIKYVCPKHGERESTITNFVCGNGCRLCADELISFTNRSNIDDVEEKINSYNNNTLLNKEDYINGDVKNLKIKCSCGNIFITSLNNYMASMSKSCNSCMHKSSIGEDIIANFLKFCNIKYISQHHFDDCRDKVVLRFDFYLPDYNCCIEFDGQGHFMPIYGKESYDKLLLHDNIKNEYCKTNGIKMIRIPYTMGEYIEDIIINELNIKNCNTSEFDTIRKELRNKWDKNSYRKYKN